MRITARHIIEMLACKRSFIGRVICALFVSSWLFILAQPVFAGQTLIGEETLLSSETAAFQASVVEINLLGRAPVSPGSGIRVENVSPPFIEAEPHNIISATFRVTNLTDTERELNADVNLPAGWHLVTPVPPFRLVPFEEKYVFVAVSIPRGVMAGLFEVSVDVTTTGFFGISDHASIMVSLLAVAEIELHAVPGRVSALAGDTYAQNFILTNNSNAASRFEIKTESDKPWNITTVPESFTLKPGEAREIIVTTRTPSDIPREDQHRLTLIADALDLDHGTVSAKARAATIIYPSSLQGDLYYSLPGTASILIASNDDNDIGAQLIIDMQGDLGNGRYGEFHLTQPYYSDWRGWRFLQEDTILMRYINGDKGYFSLGDETLSITPLTELYFYGRGLDFEIAAGDFNFRGFASKRRSAYRPEQIFGAQVSTRAGEDTELTLTAYTRKEVDVNPADGTSGRESMTWSFAAASEPADGVSLEAEYGISNSDIGDGRGCQSEDAYRVSADISADKFVFDGELVHASDGFPGYWQGTDLARAYASYNICDKLSVYGSWSDRKWSIAGNPALPHPEQRNAEFGFNWLAGDLGRITAYRYESRRRDTNLFSYDEERDKFSFQLSKQLGDFSLTARAGFGTSYDKLTGAEDDFEQYQVMFTLLGLNDSVLTGGYNWDFEESAFGSTTRSTDQMWLNADVRLSGNTSLDARFSSIDIPNQPKVNWLKTRIEHELGGGKLLQFMSQWHNGAVADTLELAVKVTFPIAIPIPILPRSGRVEGHVCLISDEPRPIPDVVVVIGTEKVATDENGHFVFPSLAEGQYELTFERATLDLDLVPSIAMPVIIDVDAGKTILVDVPIVESAAISGQVSLLIEPRPKSTKAETVAEGKRVLLVLENDGERFERYADNDGGFVFSDLRPGHYKLFLANAEMPIFHELSPGEYEFDLAPGDFVTDADFIIGPVDRPLIITTN